MSSNGQHTNPRDETRGRRNRTIAIVLALGVVAFGGGYLLATSSGKDGESAAQTPSATAPPSQTPSVGPSDTGSPSKSETTEPTPDPDALEDGLHFVKVKELGGGEAGPRLLRFDLAYLYSGEDAFAYAEEHDIVLENEYLIVNENPKLRWMPLAEDVEIEYIPTGTCCELQAGTFDGFEAAVRETAMTDYPDMGATWWFLTVDGEEITKVVQQYFP